MGITVPHPDGGVIMHMQPHPQLYYPAPPSTVIKAGNPSLLNPANFK